MFFITRKSFYIFLAVVIIPGLVMAQSTENNCTQTLKKAQNTYDQGRIFEIADMLQPCITNGFNKEEKIEAYYLLTLTYLYFNEREKAENAMLEFLKLDPEYEIKDDPTEFVNLYNSFRTTPAFLIGGRAGMDGVDVDVTKAYSLDKTDKNRGQKYASVLGFQGGVFFEVPVSKKVSVTTEVNYLSKSYTYSDVLFEYATLDFTETQQWIDVPLLLNIKFGKNTKYVPYINFGGSVSYLMKAEAEPLRKDESSDKTISREVKPQEIALSGKGEEGLRNHLNYNVSLGAGIKIKDVIGRGYLFFDVRYSHGLKNMVNTENRFNNEVLMYDYLYVDNDFRINTFQFSLGYSMPIYKPKLKKKKTKELQ